MIGLQVLVRLSIIYHALHIYSHLVVEVQADANTLFVSIVNDWSSLAQSVEYKGVDQIQL